MKQERILSQGGLSQGGSAFTIVEQSIQVRGAELKNLCCCAYRVFFMNLRAEIRDAYDVNWERVMNWYCCNWIFD